MKINITILIMLLLFILGANLFAIDYSQKHKEDNKRYLSKPTLAKTDAKTHNVGNMWLTVTNYGGFGDVVNMPSCEFPANSSVEYLFKGAIWIAALVGEDTMASIGDQGWGSGPGGRREAFWPGWSDADTILHTSMNKGPNYDSTAASEQDFIAVYTDTSLTMPRGREFAGHESMGLHITQKSYAWSYSYAEDFVIFDFVIKNVSSWVFDEPKEFKNFFMGVYIDGDCGHTSIAGYPQDDITGFMRVNSEGDTVNIAWIKDNDGDNGLTPGVTGVCPLYPKPETVSYNWWDPPQDWGPTDPSNPNDWGHIPSLPGQMYRIMSNGYVDPDQTESNAPSGINTTGMDTRYFISFGPYNVKPDSTLTLTLAYVGGLPTPSGESEFVDLGRNARWAKDVYDNPPADGIPDFKGPPPPPSPTLIVDAGDRMVTLNWNNVPEDAIDSFSRLNDFQGYRVYRSRTGVINDMELLGEYDKIDNFGYDFGYNALYPDTIITRIDTTILGVDTTIVDTVVWYTFKDYGLTNGEFMYYAVTSYDSGYAPTGLEPLESSIVINMTQVAPSAGPETPDEMQEVLVIPNPYRLSQNYFDAGWETGITDTDRRIDFTQLPPKCTIRIYTLAGDLIDIIEHDYPSRSSIAHRESWDLINRNIQAIASGIYLFVVEAEGKTYIGKFVVIY